MKSEKKKKVSMKYKKERRVSIEYSKKDYSLKSCDESAYLSYADVPSPITTPPMSPRKAAEKAPENLVSPADKRLARIVDRDEAQRKQDVEELRLQQLQVAVVSQPVETQVVAARDYTTVPGELDEKFEALDDDNALCTTTIKAGLTWTKKYKESLLAAECEVQVTTDMQKDEKNKAYDLLDALTKSGTILIDHSSLHIVCAATHCFGESLMNTVVRDNVNPVEKVERSNLIMASVIHGQSVEGLVDNDQVERVKLYSPKLFLEKC